MTAATLREGQRWEGELVRDLKRTQLVMYAGASSDFNPLHTDERYAVEVAGYPSVFAHGMLTAGMTGEAVRRLVGAERVLRFGGRFLAQVWPGDTLRVVAIVGSVDGSVARIDFDTTNQRGETVFRGSLDVTA